VQNFLNYLKFLLTATDQHGVHSPFVYNYVTKCLYSESKYGKGKSLNILLKSIAYFGAERVWLLPQNNGIQKEVRRIFPSLQFESGPYDILFTYPSEAEKLIRGTSEENKIHNNTLLLIDGIHANNTNLSFWKKVTYHQNVTVTVDMFHCGAVFFRKEQVKEHFKIRIWCCNFIFQNFVMGKYTIYAVLGILFVVYLFIMFSNRRSSNHRKDHKFMEGYKRRDEEKK